MNNNPAAATGAVVGLLVIALSVIWFTQCRGGNSGASSRATYFDTSTGQVLLVKITPGDYASPLADNATAFRCSIFSCSECQELTEGMTVADLEAKDMYIGYISRDLQAEADGMSPMDVGMANEEISAAEDVRWLTMTANRAAYEQLRQDATKCGEGRANICRPE